MPAHSCMAMRSGPENRMYGASTHINWSEPSVPESQRGTADAKKDCRRPRWRRKLEAILGSSKGTCSIYKRNVRQIRSSQRMIFFKDSPVKVPCIPHQWYSACVGDSPTCPKFEAYSFFGLK